MMDFKSLHSRICKAVAGCTAILTVFTSSLPARPCNADTDLRGQKLAVINDEQMKRTLLGVSIDEAEAKYMLGISSYFSVFILNDFSLKDADCEGRLAVGGGVNMHPQLSWNYQIGCAYDKYGTIPHDGTAHAVIGGQVRNISILEGNVPACYRDKPHAPLDGYGSYYYPKTIAVGSDVVMDDASILCWDNGYPQERQLNDTELSRFYRADLIDFDYEFQKLQSKSTAISQYQQTGDKYIRDNSYYLSGADNEVNVFNFTAYEWLQLRACNTIYLDIPYDSYAIINIDGETVDFYGQIDFMARNSDNNFYKVQANDKVGGHILYNLYNADEFHLFNNTFGSILAPFADGSDYYGSCQGHVTGSVIACSYTGTQEFGYEPYTAPFGLTETDVEITIMKIDPDNALIHSQTGFEIYTSENQLFADIDVSGSSEITIPSGLYYLIETDAPEGYKINTERQYFSVGIDGTITLGCYTDESYNCDALTVMGEENDVLAMVNEEEEIITTITITEPTTTTTTTEPTTTTTTTEPTTTTTTTEPTTTTTTTVPTTTTTTEPTTTTTTTEPTTTTTTTEPTTTTTTTEPTTTTTTTEPTTTTTTTEPTTTTTTTEPTTTTTTTVPTTTTTTEPTTTTTTTEPTTTTTTTIPTTTTTTTVPTTTTTTTEPTTTTTTVPTTTTTTTEPTTTTTTTVPTTTTTTEPTTTTTTTEPITTTTTTEPTTTTNTEPTTTTTTTEPTTTTTTTEPTTTTTTTEPTTTTTTTVPTTTTTITEPTTTTTEPTTTTTTTEPTTTTTTTIPTTTTTTTVPTTTTTTTEPTTTTTTTVPTTTTTTEPTTTTTTTVPTTTTTTVPTTTTTTTVPTTITTTTEPTTTTVPTTTTTTEPTTTTTTTEPTTTTTTTEPTTTTTTTEPTTTTTTREPTTTTTTTEPTTTTTTTTTTTEPTTTTTTTEPTTTTTTTEPTTTTTTAEPTTTTKVSKPDVPSSPSTHDNGLLSSSVAGISAAIAAFFSKLKKK